MRPYSSEIWLWNLGRMSWKMLNFPGQELFNRPPKDTGKDSKKIFRMWRQVGKASSAQTPGYHLQPLCQRLKTLTLSRSFPSSATTMLAGSMSASNMILYQERSRTLWWSTHGQECRTLIKHSQRTEKFRPMRSLMELSLLASGKRS